MAQYHDDQNYGLSLQSRNTQIKKHLFYGIIELTVAVLCVIIVYAYSSNSYDWISSYDFQSYVIFWIAVWGCLHIIYVMRRGFLMCLWKISNDPRMTHSKVNCFAFSILNTFECIWFIYGNSFFFKTIFKQEKRDESDLWKIFIVILIYGYLALLFYLLSVCGILLMLYTMWSQGYFDSKRIEQYHN